VIPVHHAVELIVVVRRRVGEVAVIRAYLGHGCAVTEHDLQTVLWFPIALALDRDVDKLVAVRVTADGRFGPESDMVEDVVRTFDLDGSLGIAAGQDVIHDVAIVGEDRGRGSVQR
jgi:hypothetical protein